MNNVAVDIGVEKPTKEEVEEVLKELGNFPSFYSNFL